MQRFLALFVLLAGFAVAACQPLSNQDRSNLGLLGGAGAGVLLADAFDANPAWTVIAGVTGAAVGTQVARNSQTGQCAYYAGTNAQGEAVYNTGPC